MDLSVFAEMNKVIAEEKCDGEKDNLFHSMGTLSAVDHMFIYREEARGVFSHAAVPAGLRVCARAV